MPKAELLRKIDHSYTGTAAGIARLFNVSGISYFTLLLQSKKLSTSFLNWTMEGLWM